MGVKLSFHGAAGCVTGFCARLQTDEATVLIDCGMFQGSKTLKALNYEPFPFAPEEIDAVLLTHAHIDHSGLLPKLMRQGFAGPIYATAATRDLCAVMLPDAGSIQESEVEQLNRRNQRRGRAKVEPIYTESDAAGTMELFRRVKLGEIVDIASGIRAVYWDAGHILGSTSIEVIVETPEGPMRILFSGDLGPGGREYAPDPKAPAGIDHLVIELTYGDRERDDLDTASRRKQLAQELRDAHAAGGPLLVPAFAVERTQELLADLVAVMAGGDAPEGDIFLDSPLAIEASHVFLDRGWNPEMGRNPFEAIRPSERLRFLREPWDSDGLDRLRGWHVILAASGMCEAGRVRKHLKRLLWRKEATVLLSGYQAVGTMGRLLAEGAKRVRIQGEDIQVKARVRMLDCYSGHADASGLVAWAKAREPIAGSVFIAHGEPEASEGLKARLAQAGFAPDRLIAPTLDATFALAPAKVEPVGEASPRIAPGAVATLDWHNARARFLLALDEQLELARNDDRREALIGELDQVLGQVGSGRDARQGVRRRRGRG